MIANRRQFVASLSAVMLLGLLVELGAQNKPVEWIFIDGAKQPWLLPEWLVWENVFSGVHTIRQRRLEGSPLDSLAVTPSELKRLENAALWYAEHSNACEERQKNDVAVLRAAKRPAAEVAKRQREVILDCRERVLERAEALLRDMSDDGRVALLLYVEAKKPGMWARVATSELEFYRQPR